MTFISNQKKKKHSLSGRQILAGERFERQHTFPDLSHHCSYLMARCAAGKAAVINLSSLNIPKERQRIKTDLLKKNGFQPTKKGVNPALVCPYIQLSSFPEGWQKIWSILPLGKYLFTFISRINYFLPCPSSQVQVSPHCNQPVHLYSSEAITAENTTAAFDSSNICPRQASWECY